LKVGEKLHPNFYDLKIVEAKAEGSARIHIMQNFLNIPFHQEKRTQRWFGDMAMFIAHNF
jgi:hypothetical protein